MIRSNNLAIDARRLWTDIMQTAMIGGTPKGGIKRLALTEEDRRVRDWFKRQCQAAGCSVRVDAIGNMFALRPGKSPDLPPIAIGSHLDTQPTGGKFDGVLGVLAGLECLRTLQDAAYETHAPILLANWTNEEGSRFAPAMIGAGVHAGVFELDHALSQRDQAGISLGEALDRIGYRGDVPVGSTAIGAMFELHIEQGPILEAEGRTIGVVCGVQGARWFDVEIVGQEAHAGSTPMGLRRDALVAAAQLIQQVDQLARATTGAAGTVGVVQVEPGSRNVVPGVVSLSVDLRHPDEGKLQELEEGFRAVLDKLERDGSVRTTTRRIWDSPPVAFADECVSCIRDAAASLGYPMREMVSGAGHDAAYIARIAPTAMIFVPCANGLSHNEAEKASLEDCAAGAQVLLQSVLAYDEKFNSGN